MNYTRLLPWLVLGLIRTVPLTEACALRRGRRRLTARRTTTDLSSAGSLDTSDLYDLALHPPSIIEAHFQEIDGGMQLFRHVKQANNNDNNNQANALWYGVTDKGDEIFLMPYRDVQGNARYVGTAHVGPTVYDMHVDRTGKQMVTPMQVSAMDGESVDVNGDEITFHRLDNTMNHNRRLAVPNNDLVTLRLIVAWTKRAECLNARLSGDCDSLDPITWQLMKAHADLAVEMTNEAFRQSGVLIRLQTVYHTRVANYTEPDEGGFQNASNALMEPDDGIMDDLHEQRGIHRAHIVALLMESRGACGGAPLGPNKDTMFPVIRSSCATNMLSFMHEIGHLFGCDHDRGTNDACDSANYNFGYKSDNFRTIMAKECQPNQCDGHVSAGSCQRVARFSGPSVVYNGVTLGNDGNDNVRRLNEQRFNVCHYYQCGEEANTATPSLVAPTTSPLQSTLTPTPTPSYFGDPSMLSSTQTTHIEKKQILILLILALVGTLVAVRQLCKALGAKNGAQK